MKSIFAATAVLLSAFAINAVASDAAPTVVVIDATDAEDAKQQCAAARVEFGADVICTARSGETESDARSRGIGGIVVSI